MLSTLNSTKSLVFSLPARSLIEKVMFKTASIFNFDSFNFAYMRVCLTPDSSSDDASSHDDVLCLLVSLSMYPILYLALLTSTPDAPGCLSLTSIEHSDISWLTHPFRPGLKLPGTNSGFISSSTHDTSQLLS